MTDNGNRRPGQAAAEKTTVPAARPTRRHAAYVRELLKEWPPLTDDQRTTLALVIRDTGDI